MDGTCNPVPAKRSFRRTRIFNQIAPYCLICPHRDTSIKWGQGVNIGMFSRLACINEISLGNTVLTGPNVFISDHNHAYTELEIFAEENPPKRVNRPEACGLRHLAFCVESVEQTVKELGELGIECEPICVDDYTGKMMTFFHDPDGLPLELHE